MSWIKKKCVLLLFDVDKFVYITTSRHSSPYNQTQVVWDDCRLLEWHCKIQIDFRLDGFTVCQFFTFFIETVQLNSKIDAWILVPNIYLFNMFINTPWWFELLDTKRN